MVAKSFSKNIDISINKMSEKTKKNFKTRFLFSFIIIGYLVISLLFFLLSNNNPQWIVNEQVNHAFAWITLIWTLPIVYFSTKEIRDIHFKQNKVSFFVIFFTLLITIYTPTLIYFLPQYHIVVLSNDDQIFWFLVSTIICFIFMLLSNFLYLWSQGLLVLKQIFVHYTLISLVAGFVLSFLFFGFVKGWTTILFLYLITALTDTFAYLTGMMFGKKKLSPFISPNKTIAGFVGGILLSTLVCIIVLICLSYVPDKYNILGNLFGIKFEYSINFLNTNNQYAKFPLWWVSITFIFIGLAIAAVVGDLSFSYIKRKYNIKDFSNLIPGHGGILDRIDSLSFVFSIFIIMISIISLFSSTSPLI